MPGILDKIDAVGIMAGVEHGFTDEEPDFIINWDIKYRMGQDATYDGDAEDDS